LLSFRSFCSRAGRQLVSKETSLNLKLPKFPKLRKFLYKLLSDSFTNSLNSTNSKNSMNSMNSYEHPLVSPQVVHLRHVPFLTIVKHPHD
jgi:hypothetical protein